jgi:diaminohydroxyphosphoribosylaminopyrimidine deaminase / 5-amino-6-(5-phosphoribosylamino)uracil reductase
VASESETAAMRRAVALSASVGERTNPNPNVGAVVLSPDGDVVGEGFHERAGGPHAEVVALERAGERARGGTVVVTLEPCTHTGRTGPCTEALLAAGVTRVVVAVADPTEVASGGAARLRAAGVQVEEGLLAAEAEAANERWLSAVRRQRPFVVWKTASTLDGKVAAPDGTSRWISSAESRLDAHRLRAECDTIVAGVGTVLADDPQLTVRDAEGRPIGRQPLRVVVDTHGRTPATAKVLDDVAPTWVATADELGKDADGGVDLHGLMAGLWTRERRLVLLEGGPTLAGSFLRSGLVDRVVAYVAPAVLGGGLPSVLVPTVTTLSDAVRLEVIDVARIGPDVRLTARPVPREGAS